MRVIVLESGIAGLAAALGLRKVGFDVAVYERAPELREVGAGISLWANALRALDYIGAGDAVRKAALALTRSEMRARDGRAAVRFANGHLDEADFVVGADGIKSAVRAALFGPEEPRYAGYTCWRGIGPRPASVRPGDLSLWVGRGSQVGDAAHPTTPNFGQGGGMAIEDAVVLARCLAANRSDPPAALAAFEAERY